MEPMTMPAMAPPERVVDSVVLVLSAAVARVIVVVAAVMVVVAWRRARTGVGMAGRAGMFGEWAFWAAGRCGYLESRSQSLFQSLAFAALKAEGQLRCPGESSGAKESDMKGIIKQSIISPSSSDLSTSLWVAGLLR